LYFGKQRFLIVKKSLIYVYFLEILRLFFPLFNVIAGLDCIFRGVRGFRSMKRYAAEFQPASLQVAFL